MQAEGTKGAAIMESIRRKPLRAFFRCSLMLLGLTCLLGTADARPKLLPSEQFPGPWLEVTQEIRDVLVLNNVSACSQAVRRQSSRNARNWRKADIRKLSTSVKCQLRKSSLKQ